LEWVFSILVQEPSVFRCSEKDRHQEEISISCIGKSPEILKEILEECRVEYLNLIRKKVSVFEHRDGEWKKIRARDIRPVSTVIMDEQEKNDLLKDMNEFLDEPTRKWYADRGIPYRREYLFFGPPGTGKSSFSLSIAGRFELDIYVVNLSGVNDSSLNKLFAELPSHCVNLLEDVDAVGLARRDDTGAAPKKEENPKSGATLSGLLNALDGVSSQEGRVLIMTTNHIDHLDEALIRPGRVDRKVYFKLADRDMTFQLFYSIFQPSAEGRRAIADQIDDETVTDRQMSLLRRYQSRYSVRPRSCHSWWITRNRLPTPWLV
jgi:chaperone BCS1